jgi:hypothetical protein
LPTKPKKSPDPVAEELADGVAMRRPTPRTEEERADDGARLRRPEFVTPDEWTT